MALIMGGPLTLYVIIKIINAQMGGVKARFVRLQAGSGERPLGVLVSWDNESFEHEICRVHLEMDELVIGGRSLALSYTFEDKSAKKRSFLIPLSPSDTDWAVLTDKGISPRALQKTSCVIEVENTKGQSFRKKIWKKSILETLNGPSIQIDKETDVLSGAKADDWSVLTRIFPWRKAVAAAATPEAGTEKAKAPAHEKKAASTGPTLVDFLVTKVWIEPGCIVCDACENEAPDVFQVLPDTCIVRENAPLGDGGAIKAAAEGCPVNVIKFTTVPKPA